MTAHAGQRLAAMPWPLPALLAWAAGWATVIACRAAGVADGTDLVAGAVLAAVLALAHPAAWRRLIAALGFPVSAALVLGAANPWPAWAWLIAALPLLLLYPLQAWRDAPFFPTPAHALAGLDALIHPAPRRVLDAGCGLGHGLVALLHLWPAADVHGVEWSTPMAWLAARRAPRSSVKRADMWAGSWAGWDLVYLFQRPETMPRAWAKAQSEMVDGAWLVSLEFPVPGVTPSATLNSGARWPVHVYRVRRAARVGAGSTGDARRR